MPRKITPTQREAFYQLARQALSRECYAYHQTGKLFSGTDCAEAPFHGVMRQVWLALARGVPVARALAAADQEWRRYAEQNNARVEAAPKIKHGPSSGQSVISHRWVSPDKVQSELPYVTSTANYIYQLSKGMHNAEG